MIVKTPGWRGFFQRHAMLAGFAAVFVPLAVLVAMQFVWLARLERLSALAHRAALDTFLDAVGTAVERHYRSAAQSTLKLPATLFVEGRLEKAEWFWRKKPIEGARRLFLVDYTRERFGSFYMFDPNGGGLVRTPASDESLAMIVAVAPWQMASAQGLSMETQDVLVDERNPEYRFVLVPITDDLSRVVGVTAMVVDRAWLEKSFLPAVVRKLAPEFLPEMKPEDLVLTIRDPDGTTIFTLGEPDGSPDGATLKMPFVFTEMTMGVHARASAVAHVARTSFLLNVGVATLLAAVLATGAWFALRTANRRMKLSQMKSDFVSNVSHELRTPVASIRVFGELLKSGRVVDPAKVAEYGEYIENESRRLSRLVDNILDFSRIESGRKSYEIAPGCLEDVVEGAVRTFQARLRDRGFALEYSGPVEALPPAPIDADAIGQAVHNLLDNAVKYSGDSKWVGVRLRRDGGDAVIEIEDRGLGIPRDEQRRIFDRFHRVGSGLIHDVKGSGLGLSITQHIVAAHRGVVKVSSEPGRGSLFTIRLPLAETAA